MVQHFANIFSVCWVNPRFREIFPCGQGKAGSRYKRNLSSDPMFCPISFWCTWYYTILISRSGITRARWSASRRSSRRRTRPRTTARRSSASTARSPSPPRVDSSKSRAQSASPSSAATKSHKRSRCIILEFTQPHLPNFFALPSL